MLGMSLAFRKMVRHLGHAVGEQSIIMHLSQELAIDWLHILVVASDS